ncbi:hypothetical protein TRFO_25854 [Tritrichomonas foetus]|uniref:Uncharacterized protein n=1 Tax=Tritrichomonas foetus TaxID=1144522 RepID=A0A1J4K4P2_9EUKA|nr:hypothetical protein TRFO_25854 [Tritrichomonas foetus]|eukprot:OHT06163.1 hypothetical protein TRFO_25854 [Tritrichomonas foetus]
MLHQEIALDSLTKPSFDYSLSQQYHLAPPDDNQVLNDQQYLYDIQEKLMSCRFETYMVAINAIQKLVKKGIYRNFCQPKIIKKLIAHSNHVYNDEPILLIFYYMTKDSESNPDAKQVIQLISNYIYEKFQTTKYSRSFKIICKIYSNIIDICQSDYLLQLMPIFDFNQLFQILEFLSKADEKSDTNEIIRSIQYCEGYLRVLVSLINRYNDFLELETIDNKNRKNEENNPNNIPNSFQNNVQSDVQNNVQSDVQNNVQSDVQNNAQSDIQNNVQSDVLSRKYSAFLSDFGMDSFFKALHVSKNQSFTNTIIKYLYYLVRWSPENVNQILFHKKIIPTICPFFTHEDKKKDHLAFYSTHILRIFARYRNEIISQQILQCGLLTLDIPKFHKNSANNVCVSLLNAISINENFVFEFLNSTFLQSIISAEPQDIYVSFGKWNINFAKCGQIFAYIFVTYPSIRHLLISTFSKDNVPLLFVKILPTQTNEFHIRNLLEVIHILLRMTSLNTPESEVMKKMFIDQFDEISEILKDELENYETYSSDLLALVYSILETLDSFVSI